MAPKFYSREINVDVLRSLDSIAYVNSINLSDWGFIYDCYRSISSMPLSINFKQYLKRHLFSDFEIDVINVRKPRILLYRFPSGEIKAFVCTEEGVLLEYDDQKIWDSCFPFLRTFDRGLSLQFMDCIPEVVSDESYLWLNHSSNFSHFLVDFFSILACLSVSSFANDLPKNIPIFNPLISWQKEYFDLVPSFQPTYFDYLFDSYRTSLLWFCPESISFPIFGNKPLSLYFIRDFLLRSSSLHSSISAVKPIEKDIVFLTRNDERRARIKNIDEIESLVINSGGCIVDPVGYSLSDRLTLFSSVKLFIAESSGCMNFACFAPSEAGLISLADPSACNSLDILVGGWTYGLGYASRTRYLVGYNSESLYGSPLGSAEFSLLRIKSYLEMVDSP